MSTMPIDPRFMRGAQGPMPGGLGPLLAQLAAGSNPGLPAIAQAPVMPTRGGPSGLGSVFVDVLGGLRPDAALPLPVPRMQTASPGSGGIAPGPIGGGDIARPGPEGVGGPAPVQTASPRRKRSTGELIAGVLADAFAGALGRPGVVGQMWQQERREEQAEDQWRARWHLQEEAKRVEREAKSREPQFTNVPGVGYVAVDPASMTSRTVVPSRSDAQVYAESLGLEPGSPEYVRSLQDYALRQYGPSGIEDREDRQSHAGELSEARLAAAAAAREAADRRAAANRSAADRRSSAGLRSRESMAEKTRQTREAGQFPEGTVIEMPDGSTKVRRGGRWVRD